MAEMKALLSFMDAEDRLKVMRRYERRFDAAGREGEAALIRELGSPVRQVLMVEREYREREEAGLPGIADEANADEAVCAEAQPEEDPMQAEAAQVMERLLSEEAQEEFIPEPPAEEYEEAAEEEPLYEDGGDMDEVYEETVEEAPPAAGRVVGAVVLTPLMILLALAGVALTVALAALGIGPGVGFAAAAAYLALYATTAMNFLPDILLVWGIAVISLALCIFCLWLGIWLLVEGVTVTVRLISRIYGKVLRKGGADDE